MRHHFMNINKHNAKRVADAIELVKSLRFVEAHENYLPFIRALERWEKVEIKGERGWTAYDNYNFDWPSSQYRIAKKTRPPEPKDFKVGDVVESEKAKVIVLGVSSSTVRYIIVESRIWDVGTVLLNVFSDIRCPFKLFRNGVEIKEIEC